MNIFRGDTFFKTIYSKEYKFRIGDKFHIAVMKNAYGNNYLHEQIKEINEETHEVDLEILPCETDKFPIGNLLLEIELTTVDGIVITNQYKLNVKADGIYEQ